MGKIREGGCNAGIGVKGRIRLWGCSGEEDGEGKREHRSDGGGEEGGGGGGGIGAAQRT